MYKPSDIKMSAINQAYKVNDVYFELLSAASDRETEQEEYKLFLWLWSCFSAFLNAFRLFSKESIQNLLE